jgi:hypothetical protein
MAMETAQVLTMEMPWALSPVVTESSAESGAVKEDQEAASSALAAASELVVLMASALMVSVARAVFAEQAMVVGPTLRSRQST